jgi:hypothetical protein
VIAYQCIARYVHLCFDVLNAANLTISLFTFGLASIAIGDQACLYFTPITHGKSEKSLGRGLYFDHLFLMPLPCPVLNVSFKTAQLLGEEQKVRASWKGLGIPNKYASIQNDCGKLCGWALYHSCEKYYSNCMLNPCYL